MPELNPHSIQRYGWVPDVPDARDLRFHARKLSLGAPLPPSVDLRSKCPPIYDQGQLGSCTANAIAAAIDFSRMAEGKLPITPSRLFIYWNERVVEGTASSDSGAMIRDGMKSVATLGACAESDWPYDIGQFAAMPPKHCFDDALGDLVSAYHRIDNTVVPDLQACLAGGFPFVFGFSVYESFESDAVARTGVVPMPDFTSERMLGGHAVMAVGYDVAAQRFLVRNSWGTTWGDEGYFTIPSAYLGNSDLADDFWTINAVT